MTKTQKNLLLDHLTVCYNHACTLKIVFLERKLSDKIEKLDHYQKGLKSKIDGLLHNLYHNWIGDAEALKGTLDETNNKLGKCIADIENNMNTAENIVKAIGYFDDIVKASAGLVA